MAGSATVIAKLILDSTGYNKGIKDAKAKTTDFSKSGEKGTSAFGKSFEKLTGVSLGAAGAFTVAAMALKKISDYLRESNQELADYATKIDDAGRLSGNTAEQTSRLIQVTDDLFISYEKLYGVLSGAARKGTDTSIEGLIRLSDEYNSLNTVQEQNLFLIDKLGKSGLELKKFMELGAEGIRTKMEAVQDSLILDREAVAQAMALKKAQDDLADAQQANMLATAKASSNLAIAWTKTKTAFVESVGAFLTVETDETKLALQSIKNQKDAIQIAIARTGATDVLINRLRELEYQEYDLNAASMGVSQVNWENFQDGTFIIEKQTGALEEEIDALRKTEKATMSWEEAWTSATTNAERDNLGLDLLKTGLEEFGVAGDEIWRGMLEGMGKISPAAIEAYVEMQTIISKIRSLLAQGFSTDVIVNYVIDAQQYGADVPIVSIDNIKQSQSTTSATIPGGYEYAGTVSSTDLTPVYRNTAGDIIKGNAIGGQTIANTMVQVNEGGKPEVLSTGGKDYLLTGNDDGMVKQYYGNQTKQSIEMPEMDYDKLARAIRSEFQKLPMIGR